MWASAPTENGHKNSAAKQLPKWLRPAVCHLFESSFRRLAGVGESSSALRSAHIQLAWNDLVSVFDHNSMLLSVPLPAEFSTQNITLEFLFVKLIDFLFSQKMFFGKIKEPPGFPGGL